MPQGEDKEHKSKDKSAGTKVSIDIVLTAAHITLHLES